MSKSPSLRRIQADIRELALDPSDRYHAAPLEHDMFEWHFTIRGADKTDFEGGVYHGRIMLPPEYPFKPPHIIFLTPSGRFETNTKVCLSFSAYHPELWQPAWGIRLILEALISFLPTPADGAIGALDWTSAERKRLAQKSVTYACPTCGCKAIELLPKLKPKTEASGDETTTKTTSKFQKEIEKLQQWQSLEHKIATEEGDAKPKDDKDDKAPTEEPALTEEAPATTTASAGTSSATTAETTQQDTNEAFQAVETKPKVAKSAAQAAPTPGTQNPNMDPTPVVPPPRRPDPLRNETPNPPAQQADQIFAQEEVPLMPQQRADEDDMYSWMVDPVLHGIIVTLGVLCFLLMRKLQVMMEELNSLNEVLEG